MNENEMNGFCDYLEELGVIDSTEVCLRGPNGTLYGRTFTKPDNDGRGMRYRIEIYGNEEHTNEEILYHEMAHVILYKIDYPQDHGEEFERMEQKATQFMKDYLKEIYNEN